MKKIPLTFFLLLFWCITIHADETESPQQFEGFNLAGYEEGGKKTWDVKGDTADIIGNIVKLTNIVANAYGAEQMNLTAKNGTVQKDTGLMHLENDVVITTNTGTKLTTDTLNWERSKDLVQTDDDVTITREGLVATGTGALGHPSLKDAQLNKDVTVTFETNEGQSASGAALGRVVTITCDGSMEMEYENQKATFNDNVVAIDGDRKLTADKMEVFFDTEASQIKELICIGHVSVVQGENSTYSEKAVYNAAEKKLTLSGRPKLILYTAKEGGLSFGESGSDKPVSSDSKKE